MLRETCALLAYRSSWITVVGAAYAVCGLTQNMYTQIKLTRTPECDSFSDITRFFADTQQEEPFFLIVADLVDSADSLQSRINRWFLDQELPWRIESWEWSAIEQAHVLLFRGVEIHEVFMLMSTPD